jgi:hypothetical protein
MGLLAAAVQAAAGGGYRLRRADGADQLSAANADLHHLLPFGLFMKFDRLQLLAFVVPVWAVNISFSLFWLRISVRGRWNGCGVS